MSKYLAKFEFDSEGSGYYIGYSLWNEEDVKLYNDEFQASKNSSATIYVDICDSEFEEKANNLLSAISYEKITDEQFNTIKSLLDEEIGIYTPSDVLDDIITFIDFNEENNDS